MFLNTVTNTINNLGGTVGGDTVALTATQDINNTSTTATASTGDSRNGITNTTVDRVSGTTSCANGDTACITGIGQQQNAPLTQQARNAIADGASGLSRQAGVVAASATTVTTVAPPQVKPVSGAVAVGATVIGLGADAVEQLVRPDLGQTGINAAGAAVSEIINKKVPVLAPITNEIVEAAKASDVSKSIQEKLNAGTDLGK